MAKTEKTKAVLYARFSPRKNSDKCESVEAQFDFCRRYCDKNNIDIEKEFSDRALSGDEIDRPGLWQAIDALKKGYLLVVYKLDRLARSVYLSSIIERSVLNKRATILSISGEGTWKDTPEDCFMRQILQASHELERKVISARTKAAVLRYQAQGRRMSHLLPYGYKLDPKDSKRMVVEPKEQATILEICRLSREGLSYRKIAEALNKSKDFKPRKRKKMFRGKPVLVNGHWHHYLVGLILKRNPS